MALVDAPIARMMARQVTKRVAAVRLGHHQAQLVLGCLDVALEDAPIARMMARQVTKRVAAVGQGHRRARRRLQALRPNGAHRKMTSRLMVPVGMETVGP